MLRSATSIAVGDRTSPHPPQSAIASSYHQSPQRNSSLLNLHQVPQESTHSPLQTAGDAAAEFIGLYVADYLKVDMPPRSEE